MVILGGLGLTLGFILGWDGVLGLLVGCWEVLVGFGLGGGDLWWFSGQIWLILGV